MIVTINCNTSLDFIYTIPAWQPGQTLRASSLIQSIGGKMTDVSWVLAEMGITSLALGFSAGLTGEVSAQLLREQGVMVDYITVGGESRRNLVIADQADDDHTAITVDLLIVSEADVTALRQRFSQALDDCEVAVLGGTLPGTMSPDFYTDIVRLARERDVPVIFDGSGAFLRAGLASRPNYIKPNRSELSALVGKPIQTIDDAYHAGREIVQRYGVYPIITLGSDGGLAILNGRAYRIPPLDVPVVNATGAGDALDAGLAASVFRGQPIEEGLRLGFAAATTVVTTPHTAECSLPEIERYAAQIELIPYEPV